MADDSRYIPYDPALDAPFPNYKFWNAERFFTLYRAFWVVYLRGMWGKGKTSTGALISYEMIRTGVVDRMYGNFPCRYTVPIVPPVGNAVMQLDEAAELLDARSFASNDTQGFTQYLRKINLYLVLSSVHNIDVRLRFFTLERTLNFANKVWLFKWSLDAGSTREVGRFVVLRPYEVFSSYDTRAFTGMQKDGGFKDALDVTVEIERRKNKDWNGKDFYLPWFDFGTMTYNPPASIEAAKSLPYNLDLLDDARDAAPWISKSKRSRGKSSRRRDDDGESALVQAVLNEREYSKFSGSYPN